MKAFCIRKEPWGPHGGPHYMEECEVSEGEIWNDCFKVQGYPANGTRGEYEKRFFIPISDIDETEFIRETLIETV